MSAESARRGGPTASDGQQEEQLGAAPSGGPVQLTTTAPSHPERCNILLLSFLSFCLIVFCVWVVSAGKNYREEYAQATQGWRVGSIRVVEITLIQADRENLACASNATIAGLHCAFRRNGEEAGALSLDDPQLLQPYNTVGNEPLLGAGLWRSPDLQGLLPRARFTVVCNYHVKGVVKSAAVRYAPTAPFERLNKTVTVGTLTDCTLPQ